MASTTFTFTTTVSDGAASIYVTNSVTDQIETKLDVALTASQANLQRVIAFSGTKVVGYVISADYNTNIYVNDASSGSPAATITVKGNSPKIYFTNSGFTNEFGSISVTSLYFTAATANATNVKVWLLLAAA